MPLLWFSVITAHIQRTREGNIFSLFTPGGGTPSPSHNTSTGLMSFPGSTLPPSHNTSTAPRGLCLGQVPGQNGGRVPWGTPIQVRSQIRMGEGYPHPGQVPGQDGGRVPQGIPIQVRSQVRMGGGGSILRYPHPGQVPGQDRAEGVPPIQVRSQVRIGVQLGTPWSGQEGVPLQCLDSLHCYSTGGMPLTVSHRRTFLSQFSLTL